MAAGRLAGNGGASRRDIPGRCPGPRWGRALREPYPRPHPRRGFHPLDPQKAVPLFQRVGRSAARTRLNGSDNWRRGYFYLFPDEHLGRGRFSATHCPSGVWRRGYGGVL